MADAIKLYKNLISKQIATENEIGTPENFAKSLKDPKVASNVYDKVMQSKKVTEKNMGTKGEFVSSFTGINYSEGLPTTKDEPKEAVLPTGATPINEQKPIEINDVIESNKETIAKENKDKKDIIPSLESIERPIVEHIQADNLGIDAGVLGEKEVIKAPVIEGEPVVDNREPFQSPIPYMGMEPSDDVKKILGGIDAPTPEQQKEDAQYKLANIGLAKDTKQNIKEDVSKLLEEDVEKRRSDKPYVSNPIKRGLISGTMGLMGSIKTAGNELKLQIGEFAIKQNEGQVDQEYIDNSLASLRKEYDTTKKETQEFIERAPTMEGGAGELIGGIIPFALMAATTIAAPPLAPVMLGTFGVSGYGEGLETYDRAVETGQTELDPKARQGLGLLYAGVYTIPVGSYFSKVIPTKHITGTIGRAIFSNPKTANVIGKEIFETVAKKSPSLAKMIGKNMGHGIGTMASITAGKDISNALLADENKGVAGYIEDAKHAIAAGVVFGALTSPLATYNQLATTKARREKQGRVIFAIRENGKPIEIIPTNDGSLRAVDMYGKEVKITEADAKNPLIMTNDHFNNALKERKAAEKLDQTAPEFEREVYANNLAYSLKEMSNENNKINVPVTSIKDVLAVKEVREDGKMEAITEDGRTVLIDEVPVKEVDAIEIHNALMEKYDKATNQTEQAGIEKGTRELPVAEEGPIQQEESPIEEAPINEVPVAEESLQAKEQAEIQELNDHVDSTTHKDGKVYNARDYEDKVINVISGKIVLKEDGTIDASKSDKRVIVREETGKKSFLSTEDIKGIESIANANDVKEVGAESLKEQAKVDMQQTAAVETFNHKGEIIKIEPKEDGTFMGYTLSKEGVVTDSYGMTIEDVDMVKGNSELINSEPIANKQPVQEQQPNVQDNAQMEEASMQDQAIQEQGPQFPLDKDGNIDYEKIDTPILLADAYKADFQDEAINIIDEEISDLTARIEKVSNSNKRPREKAKEVAELNKDLFNHNQAKESLQPKEVEQVSTPVDSVEQTPTPVESVEQIQEVPTPVEEANTIEQVSTPVESTEQVPTAVEDVAPIEQEATPVEEVVPVTNEVEEGTEGEAPSTVKHADEYRNDHTMSKGHKDAMFKNEEKINIFGEPATIITSTKIGKQVKYFILEDNGKEYWTDEQTILNYNENISEPDTSLEEALARGVEPKEKTTKVRAKKKSNILTPHQKKLQELGEPITDFEAVLMWIAQGGKLRFNNSASGTKGLLAELGFKKGSSEARRLFQLQNENEGLYPIQFGEKMLEDEYDYLFGTKEDSDIRDMLIDAIMSGATGKGQALSELTRMREKQGDGLFNEYVPEDFNDVELTEDDNAVLDILTDEQILSLDNTAPLTEEELNAINNIIVENYGEESSPITTEAGNAANEVESSTKVEEDSSTIISKEPKTETERKVEDANAELDDKIVEIERQVAIKEAELKGKSVPQGELDLFGDQEPNNQDLFKVARTVVAKKTQKEIDTTKKEIKALKSEKNAIENNREKAIKEVEAIDKTQTDIASAESVVNTDPTKGQQEAGNYKKGSVTVQGIDISIENPVGSVRKGIDEDGKAWEHEMKSSYGYIKRTEGKDGDHVDVFIGNNPASQTVFVIDQVKVTDRTFDESKVMLGYDNALQLKEAYLENYDEGWDGLSDITEVNINNFKEWLYDGARQAKPFAEYVDTPAPRKNVDADINAPSGSKKGYKGLSSIINHEAMEMWGYEKSGENGDSYMPLSIEKQAIAESLNIYDDPKAYVLITEQNYIQEGDLMTDPRIDWGVFPSYGVAIPLNYEMNGLGLYKEFVSEGKIVDEKGLKDTLHFANSLWFPNLIEQGRTFLDIKQDKPIDNENNSDTVSRDSSKEDGGIPTEPITKDVEEGTTRAIENDNQPSGGSTKLGDNSIKERGEQGRGQGDNVRPIESEPSTSEHNESGVERGPNTSDTKDTSGVVKNANNLKIQDPTNVAPKGAVTKTRANIAAIKLSKKLADSGERATPEQMEVLSKYTGWGGLSSAFKDGDNFNDTLKKELTEEEYNSARASTTTSFYTPTELIADTWTMIEKLGFKGGDILEPSAVIGHFFGMMPESISSTSNLRGIELDTISGNILKQLYPDSKIDVSGFEEQRIKNNSVDLVVTNVPFGDFKVHDKLDKDLSSKFNIHDYFIAKSVRKLKPKGIGVFITTSSTMDKSAPLRNWLINEGNADVIDAFRLNTDTFKSNAGTEATADIIIIRKRDESGKSPYAKNIQDAATIREGEYQIDTKWDKKEGEYVPVMRKVPMRINSYFADNPQKMAGEMKFGFEGGNEMRASEQRLAPVNGVDQQAVLNNFIKDLPTNIFGAKATEVTQDTPVSADGTKEGGLTIIDGKPYIIRYGEAVPVEWNANKVAGKSKTEATSDYLKFKDTLNQLLEAENNDSPNIESLRKQLNKEYDSFVGKYGTLSRNGKLPFLREDVDFPSISAIENEKDVSEPNSKTRNYEISKSDIFYKRVIEKTQELKAETVSDGIKNSIYKNGKLDIDYVANLLSRPVEQVKAEILSTRQGFENPTTGLIESKEEYLSGNVREKLVIAEQANEL
jgi:hypothetical protein